MNKFLSIAGGAALALSATAASAQDTLRIGTEGAYPPYNFTDASGNLVGFEIELGKEICERTGMTCEFVAQNWDGIIPALQNGRYDAIMAGMSITEERKQQIDFTQGYITTPAWFVASADSELQQAETIEQVREALSDVTVGVQVSTIHQNFLQEEIPDAELKLYETQDLLNLDLAAGRVDVGLADSSAWEPFLGSEEGAGFAQFGPGLTGDDFPIFGEGVGIGLRQDDDELEAKLNQALCEIKQDGTMTALATEWFGYDIAMAPKEGVCQG
ncbi:MAG TPA: transporter substrate-binding domain-containing protein [Alphaproteobacteria bacterium]|nr:transporter substrate-binding domain-containing protein [Alphaproteobacteria bacterium]